MSQTKTIEKIKTHVSCAITCPENRAIYYIMWEKYGTTRQATDDNIIGRMRIACWITGYRHTLRICNTVKPVLNGISRDQNIFPLKPGFRLIKVHYI